LYLCNNINQQKKIKDEFLIALNFGVHSKKTTKIWSRLQKSQPIGKNKKRKQIKDVERSFVVKDDVLLAQKGEIPLYLFGFLY
jgi:hypothetical protein